MLANNIPSNFILPTDSNLINKKYSNQSKSDNNIISKVLKIIAPSFFITSIVAGTYSLYQKGRLRLPTKITTFDIISVSAAIISVISVFSIIFIENKKQKLEIKNLKNENNDFIININQEKLKNGTLLSEYESELIELKKNYTFLQKQSNLKIETLQKKYDAIEKTSQLKLNMFQDAKKDFQIEIDELKAEISSKDEVIYHPDQDELITQQLQGRISHLHDYINMLDTYFFENHGLFLPIRSNLDFKLKYPNLDTENPKHGDLVVIEVNDNRSEAVCLVDNTSKQIVICNNDQYFVFPYDEDGKGICLTEDDQRITQVKEILKERFVNAKNPKSDSINITENDKNFIKSYASNEYFSFDYESIDFTNRINIEKEHNHLDQ